MTDQSSSGETFQLPDQYFYGGEPPPPPPATADAAPAAPVAPAEPVPVRPAPPKPTDQPPLIASLPPLDLPDDEIEPPIERHDPFAFMRGARWMNRELSPQGRAARRMQEELEAFPVLEGRQPNTADIDALAKRVVDHMVPIFRREQLTDIAYDILEERRQQRIAAKRGQTHATATAAAAIAADSLLRAPQAAEIASRIGSHVAGALARTAGTVGMIVVPTKLDYGTTASLAKGLRARRLTGQRSIEIERRVDDGVLGSGVGAKWERIDVAAEYAAGPDGSDVLQIDADQLARAIGRETAARVLDQAGIGMSLSAAVRDRRPGETSPGHLPILEMRITSTVDRGVKVEHKEIADADVAKFCPTYGTVLKDALEASILIKGWGIPNGPTYGRLVHAEVERRLKAHRIPNLETERGIHDGAQIGYLKAGSSKIDVIEKLDHDTACVYDVKTGGAEFRDSTRERYLRAAAAYFKVSKVYVLPVHVQ